MEIHPERTNPLNRKKERAGDYVLYWMQSAVRAKYNHALEYAVDRANERNIPVLAVFCLVNNFPNANQRHYHFMLEGLSQTRKDLADKGIRLAVIPGEPDEIIKKMSKNARLTVTDEGYLRIQRKWRKQAANIIECPLIEVCTNTVVPLESASDKEEYAARTIRPRINKRLDEFLIPIKENVPKKNSMDIKTPGIDLSDPNGLIRKMKIDLSVSILCDFRAGTAEAEKTLAEFIKHRLDNYDSDRNDPSLEGQSCMSPYLHFGQISPVYIALEVRKVKSKGTKAYLEELIIRRELAQNFVRYNSDYDNIKSIPGWCANTLRYHKKDNREYIYTAEELENAGTHDEYWNAAQRQMVLTGKMHGYMRMYWGKKVIEWTNTPQYAYRMLVYLNDKYELDGRDPNGYAGIAWCFGKHDQPWAERKIFGKVRYMSADGLKRKFDMDGYVRKIEKPEKKIYPPE